MTEMVMPQTRAKDSNSKADSIEYPKLEIQ